MGKKNSEKNGKEKTWINEAKKLIKKPQEERNALLDVMKVGKPEKHEFIVHYISEVERVKQDVAKQTEEPQVVEVQKTETPVIPDAMAAQESPLKIREKVLEKLGLKDPASEEKQGSAKPAVLKEEQKKEGKERKGKGGRKVSEIKIVTGVGTKVEAYDFNRMLLAGSERLILKSKEETKYKLDIKHKAKDSKGNVLRYPIDIAPEYFASDEAKIVEKTKNNPEYTFIPVYFLEKGKNPKTHIHLRDGLKVCEDGHIRGLAELCFLSKGESQLKIPYMNVFPFENGTTEPLFNAKIGIVRPDNKPGLVYAGPSQGTYQFLYEKGQKPKQAKIEGFISLCPIQTPTQ